MRLGLLNCYEHIVRALLFLSVLHGRIENLLASAVGRLCCVWILDIRLDSLAPLLVEERTTTFLFHPEVGDMRRL